MNEQTVVVTVNLPSGRDWEWYPDANVVALAPHLDERGRDRALADLQTQWRRSLLRIVPAATVAAVFATGMELLPVVGAVVQV